MSEARLVAAETGGLVPESDGWFVLDAKDARWLDGDLGAELVYPADPVAKGLEYAWGSYREGWLPG